MNKIHLQNRTFGRPTISRIRRRSDILIGTVAFIALIAASFATFKSAHASEKSSTTHKYSVSVVVREYQVPENPAKAGLRAVVGGGNASEVSPSSLPEFQTGKHVAVASLFPPISGRHTTLAGLVLMLAGLSVLIIKMWRDAAGNMAKAKVQSRASRRIN